METFVWSMHTQSTEYPEGFKTKLGNSYTFASEPRAIYQRIFKLKFNALKYFTYSNGTIDRTFMPALNMGALELFYQQHEMWKDFIYPHPVYGNVVAKFHRPLVVPEGVMGGGGVVQGFGLELEEQP